jgi:hypothetical protein
MRASRVHVQGGEEQRLLQRRVPGQSRQREQLVRVRSCRLRGSGHVDKRGANVLKSQPTRNVKPTRDLKRSRDPEQSRDSMERLVL